MSFNLTTHWTERDVAILLASVRDDRNWRIIVDKSGNVSLLDCDANPTPFDQLHCYFETYSRGTDHVGPRAAADTRHVTDIAMSLRENWPHLKGDAYIDH